MAACYEVARRVAADNFSDFYWSQSEFGPRWPRRGAGHRHAYWNGRTGCRSTFVQNSPAHAYWAAGVDDRRDDIQRGGSGLRNFDYGRATTTTPYNRKAVA